MIIFSCKKSDVIVPEDVMNGKLKEMIFSDFSTDQFKTPVDLFYSDDGRLSSIDFKNKKIFEWLTKPDDSLVFRYCLGEDETGEVSSIDFNVIKNASGVILSIIGLPNENYLGGGTLFYFSNVENNLELGLISSNTPLVSGFPGGKSNIYDYQFYNNGFKSNIGYSYQDLTNPPYSVYEVIDTIRVEFNELTTKVPMPTQTYGLVIPWNHYGNYFGILFNHFLILSGYQIYQPYTQLPEKVFVNNVLKYTIDYQQNGLNQINKMTYNYLGEKVGEIEFEYY